MSDSPTATNTTFIPPGTVIVGVVPLWGQTTPVILPIDRTTHVIGNSGNTASVIGNSGVVASVIGNSGVTASVIGNSSVVASIVGNSGVTASVTANSGVPGVVSPSGGFVLGYVGDGGVTLNLHRQPPATAVSPPIAPAGDGKSILAWEDDPLNPILTVTGVPALGSVQITHAQPIPGQYPPGSGEFRYWNAASALDRCLKFWQKIDADWTWKSGPQLPVHLDAGSDMNAYYDRRSLAFFHADTRLGRVWSGESPDILCHELGHAILDAIKPQLWNSANSEVVAFHEAFGDISALMTGLTLKDLRNAVLDETGGRLYRSSRLSRMAEQLGAAIRLDRPEEVDRDCMRNAVNPFVYADPMSLPHQATASRLSSEPHSFSRVFTGAYFEALAVLLAVSTPNEADRPDRLLALAERLSTLLVRSIRRAPVVSNFFAQIAAGMVRAAVADRDDQAAGVLRGVFIRRSILSVRSATAASAWLALDDRYNQEPDTAAEAMPILIEADQYGLDRPFGVEASSSPRAYAASSASPEGWALNPASSQTSAQSFMADIMRRGRVDFGDWKVPQLHLERLFTTHKLVADGGVALLHRKCFDCGLHGD